MAFFPPPMYLLSLLVTSNIGTQDNIRKNAFYEQSILIIEN